MADIHALAEIADIAKHIRFGYPKAAEQLERTGERLRLSRESPIPGPDGERDRRSELHAFHAAQDVCEQYRESLADLAALLISQMPVLAKRFYSVLNPRHAWHDLPAGERAELLAALEEIAVDAGHLVATADQRQTNGEAEAPKHPDCAESLRRGGQNAKPERDAAWLDAFERDDWTDTTAFADHKRIKRDTMSKALTRARERDAAWLDEFERDGSTDTTAFAGDKGIERDTMSKALTRARKARESKTPT